MATLDMLNVAIGMIFIYLLLSLLASAINEMIEGFIKNRAANLKRGIKELIAPSVDKDASLLQSFYEHPLICSFYRGNFKKNKDLPSYIPSSSFATVLISLMLTHNAGDKTIKPSAGANSGPGSSDPVISMQLLKEAIEKWPYQHSRKAILTLWYSANNDFEKFRLSAETWYNNAMDRVTGWYKRRVQFMLVIIGFVLSLSFNADSIALFKSLVKDAPLRNSLVAASQEFARGADTLQKSPAKIRFNENLERINNLRLPLGWDWKYTAKDDRINDISVTNYSLAIPTNDGNGLFWNCVSKISGLLLTALAISLGAPFWFDMLNKVTAIRNSIKPKEKEADDNKQASKTT